MTMNQEQPSFSSSEVRRISKRVARQAATEAINDYQEKEDDSGIDDNVNTEELEAADVQTDSDVKTELQRISAFDIFDDVGAIRAGEGDVVEYRIMQNGSLKSVVNHPYSWQQIQQNLGPGVYQVIAKSGITRKHLKSQTKTVASAVPMASQAEKSETKANDALEAVRLMQESFKSESERRERELREERERLRQEMKEQKETFMNQQTSSQGTLGDIVKALLIKPNDNSAIDSVKEEIKAQANNTTTLLSTILPLIMQKPQDNTSERMMEMMMKMQEMNMQNQKELALQMQSNLKELREDTMKLFTELKEQGKDASKRDPLELYLTAMKQGMDQRALIEELAEEKANARSAKEDSEEGSSKNDSLADTIIKAAIPSLMGAFANKGAPQPMPEQQQVQYRPQVRANPAPQRGVPRQAGSVSVASQPATQARTSESQNGSSDTRQNQDLGRQSIPNGSSGKQNSLGLPTVGAKTVEIEPNSSILEKEKLNEAEYHKAKQMVIEIMSPVIVNSLLNQLSPVEGSRECATILIQNNMNPLVVHRMFTEQEILDLANNLGNINDQEYPGVGAWLKEFYDNIPTEAQQLLNGSGNT